MVAAVLGCAFGVLGILTIGAIFVPLAAFCTLGAVIDGLWEMKPSIIFIALIGFILTIIGWATSPGMWFLTAAIVAAFAPLK